MFCKSCGREMTEANRFCLYCGGPLNSAYTNRVPPQVTPVYKQEDGFIASVTAVLFGLSMVAGGIYSIVECGGDTKWAIMGGLSAALAGTSCTAKGVCRIERILKTKRRNKDEQ